MGEPPAHRHRPRRYAFTDLPSGELAPGQTISLALNKPIRK